MKLTMKWAILFLFFCYNLQAAEVPFYHQGPTIIEVQNSSLSQAPSLADKDTIVFTEVSGVILSFGENEDLYEGPKTRTLFNTLKVKTQGVYGLSGESPEVSNRIRSSLTKHKIKPTNVVQFYDGYTVSSNKERGYPVWALSTVYASKVIFAGGGQKGDALLSFLEKAKIALPQKFLVIDHSQEWLRQVKEIFSGGEYYLQAHQKHRDMILWLRKHIKEVTLYNLSDDE